MHRLINAYRALPSISNRARLQQYLNRHPMAVCLAEPADLAFLRTHGFAV